VCVFNPGLKQDYGMVVPGLYGVSKVRAMLENFNSFGASLKTFCNTFQIHCSFMYAVNS
jgi:hypothetical protein